LNPQGTSAAFATAQANKTNSQIKDFVLTRAKSFTLASIDNETIDASKGDANAFMEALTVEIDGSLHQAARSLAIDLYGTGSGSLGQLSATSGVTTLITLSDIESVTNFEVGQKLVLSTANGGGTVKTGTITVTGVNRDLGTVTVSPSMATLSAVGAVNDYIFREGDYDQRLKGLQAWLPASAPTGGDNFFSVDRSVDTSRLAGIRFDGTNQPIEEVLIKAASRVAREGGKPNYCFVNYAKFAELENALGSKVQYIDLKANAEIGFRGVVINGPRGPIKVVPDANCPGNKAFMLDLSVWKLYSLGKAPKILDTDGLKMLRESNANAVEIRIGFYAQLGCNAPGYNAVISL